MEAERRQVTILFTDMVGFTAFSERQGEEAAYTLMRSLSKLMDEAVREHGGVVQGFTGDGIMAVFGAPVAFEDAPLRACRAALSILQRIKVAAPDLEAKHGVRPQLRIGLNTGAAVVGKVQEGADAQVTVLGDTVNFASRVQALAEPNSVFMSEATHRLVQGLVDTTFAGEHNIKGKSEQQKVYRLDAIRHGATRFEAAVSRGLSAFVGRERELEVLERGLDEARSELRVIDLVAEPGMGKSRLLHEFRQRIGKERAFVLSGSCSPDGQQTPFLPFIEVVRGSFRVSAGEAEKDVAQKAGDGTDGARPALRSQSRPVAPPARSQSPRRCVDGARWRADRLAHARAFAATAGSALPPLACGHGDRGFALDRQRIGGIAGQDRRQRGQAAASAPHHAPAGIRAGLARPRGGHQITSRAAARWRHPPLGTGAARS